MVVLLVILIAGGVFAVWLVDGVARAKWAINLVGGNSALMLSDRKDVGDSEYISSTRINMGGRKLEEVVRGGACTTSDSACMAHNLALANVLSIAGGDLDASRGIIDFYSSDELSRRLDECPVRLELSGLIYEVSRLMESENGDRARALLSEVKMKGGVVRPINTDVCRLFFTENPQFARAYLGQLSILMSMDDKDYSAAWLYSLHKSGYAIF